MYFQRYIPHFPAAGEIVIFDRSWYNRTGVECMMGFCTSEEHRQFLILCPEVEQYIVDDQVLAGGRQGGAGATFLGSNSRSLATVETQPNGSRIIQAVVPILEGPRRDLKATNTKFAPWNIVRSDDKRRARLNCISHILKTIPSGDVPRSKVKLPKRAIKDSYDDQASLQPQSFVGEIY